VTGSGEFEPGDLPAGAEQALEHGITDAHERLAAAKAAQLPETFLHGTRAELAADPLSRALGAATAPHTLPSYAWF
jgi:hypothetical protein